MCIRCAHPLTSLRIHHCVLPLPWQQPPVKELAEHLELVRLAKANKVLVMVEYHKRWDPIYRDARFRMNTKLGDFSFFQSFMSQPKFQLETFRAWAGKSSDISYYLNSHHIDVHCWGMQDIAKPTSVTASIAAGVAQASRWNILHLPHVDCAFCTWRDTPIYSQGERESERESEREKEREREERERERGGERKRKRLPYLSLSHTHTHTHTRTHTHNSTSLHTHAR